jgi:hypothetical protein
VIEEGHAQPVKVPDPMLLETYDRWTRIQQNNNENLPYGLLAGVFSALIVE